MKKRYLLLALMLTLCLAVFVSCSCDHRDANDDDKCDKCNESYTDGVDICNHRDANDDSKCEYCGEAFADGSDISIEIWNDHTPIKIKTTANSNNKELPSTCARYLAGELTQEEKYNDYDNIDIMIARRNNAAYANNAVNVSFEYFPEGDSYSCSRSINVIANAILSGKTDRADIYYNFSYDMIAASFKGCFKNLYATSSVKGGFSFLKEGYEDTGEGYMYEYMRSTTISDRRLYLIASDYFIDTFRGAMVVPVNLSLLESIPVSADTENAYNSDRNGDGRFSLEDLYSLVMAGEWNYSTLADFSAGISAIYGPATDLNGTVGFALSTFPHAAKGMIYSSGVRVLQRGEDGLYYYPKSCSQLSELCDALTSLFTGNEGVITVDGTQCFLYGPSANFAIRSRFAEGRVLFGDVVLLGSLERDEYRDMKDGYGVLPVPLYRATNPETGKPDSYNTQINRLGKLAAIAVNTEHLEAAVKFLEYQSVNSTRILEEYFHQRHGLYADGVNRNGEMLKYIRKSVGFNLDVMLEDANGFYWLTVSAEAKNLRLYNYIMKADYRLTGEEMTEKYEELYADKVRWLSQLREILYYFPE